MKSPSKDNIMRFRDFVRDIETRLKKSSIDRKTRKRLRSYHDSGAVRYSRLYGFRQTPNGIEIVVHEARIIRSVLQMLAAGKSVPEIKQSLDSMNLRNRSGNLFPGEGGQGDGEAHLLWFRGDQRWPVDEVGLLPAHSPGGDPDASAEGATKSHRGVDFCLPCG